MSLSGIIHHSQLNSYSNPIKCEMSFIYRFVEEICWKESYSVALTFELVGEQITLDCQGVMHIVYQARRVW